MEGEGDLASSPRLPGLEALLHLITIISQAARLLLGIGSLLKKSCKSNNRAVQGTEDLAL